MDRAGVAGGSRHAGVGRVTSAWRSFAPLGELMRPPLRRSANYLLAAGGAGHRHWTAQFHHQFRACGKHGGTMFPEPVCDGHGGSNGSADEEAFAATRQTADQHSTSGAHADFREGFAVVARAFELPFLVDVGA